MNETVSQALKNWIPYRLNEQSDPLSCRWLYLGNEPITEPFFDETISKCMKQAENSHWLKAVSSLDILPEWSQQIETVKPSAIIFHISRCGSTLVSQLLSQQSSNIVLSEVPFFDALLRWGKKNDKEEEASELLRASIQLYGARRNEKQDHLFIKADSWHIHFYPQLRALYPDIPFFLLYRRPDEVIRSQQKRRGMQSIPGLLEPEIFGFDRNEITGMDMDEYMARVIESYLQAFIAIMEQDKKAFLVSYHEGISAFVQQIAKATNLEISEDEWQLMNTRAAYHAKYPEQHFAEEKKEELIPAYLNKALELYHAVDQIRKQGNA